MPLDDYLKRKIGLSCTEAELCDSEFVDNLVKEAQQPNLDVPDTYLLHTAFSVDEIGTKDKTFVTSEAPTEISVKSHMDVLMRPLQVALASAVIQECIEKLNFMVSQCPFAKSRFDFKDVQMRFKKFQYPCKDVVIVQQHDEELNWKKKLAQDVDLLQKGLNIAKADLLYDDHIVFHCYLRNELWKWRNEYNLCDLHEKLSESLNAMKISSELLKTADTSGKSQTQLNWLHKQELYEETCFKYGTAIEYIQKFNTNRIEQNRLYIEEQEKKQLEDSMAKVAILENEKTVHENVVKYYKQALDKLEGEILHWRQKYTKDMEEMEYITFSLLTETSRQAATLAEILALYYLREMQIENYVEKKEEIFYLEVSEYAMDLLYTSIQAWWRGTMVRWEIGPYDSEKKKKKPLKGKK